MEKFLVEISARHVHVSQEDLEVLFGKGAELHPVKDLSQPGQYASEEKVVLRGPKGELSARILGPTRSETQVEITLTEARQLGVKALIRESGDLDGTEGGLTLVGPAGELPLEKGVIAAKRHVHMTPSDAEKYGVTNGQVVGVKIETPERSIVFGDTVIRVSDKYALAMHVDTDEANAAGISGSAEGEIVSF
ncbi:MAG: phosphate propanoyltransferase [Solobacterium sp.]|nr:phosphate propanoyltransferase [Solobacterium sp.]